MTPPARTPGASTRLRLAGRQLAVSNLLERSAGWIERARAAGDWPLAVVASSPVALLAAAAHLEATRRDGVVVAAGSRDAEITALLDRHGYSLLRIAPPDDAVELVPTHFPRPPVPGRIGVLTSATAGPPKLRLHSWETLHTYPEGRAPTPQCWLLTYRAGTYAWFQMVTLWRFTPGQALAVSDRTTPEEIWDDGMASGFDAVSATPTFWRYLLALRGRDRLARAPLRQITLGGEPVTQDLLDTLAQVFPTARLTHVYASTEAGPSIVVHDGREGFPASWLGEDTPRRCRLRRRDGVLEIRSPFAATGAAGAAGWIHTGDRLEIRGDRAVVTGRADEGMVNVGGLKVGVAEVESVLQACELVAWCRVHGRRAPITGHLVAAEVVLTHPGRLLSPGEAESRLTAHCLASGLESWMTPRFWTFLAEVPMTAATKTARHG